MTNKWGRNEAGWDVLVDETADFLGEQARLQRTTSYTELNAVLTRRTGLAPFDFAKDSDRAAMGAMLGQVAHDQLKAVGAMLSAIVIYLNENDAGAGFYRYATELGLLTARPSQSQREAFWVDQVAKVYAHYASGQGRA